MQSYRGILADGLSRGAFHPRLHVDQIAMTFVALEDAYGLHIVGGNALVTVAKAAESMRAVAAELGCPTSPA
jgi:hypothetical protein